MAKECRDMRELRDNAARHYGRQVVQFSLSLPNPEIKEATNRGSLFAQLGSDSARQELERIEALITPAGPPFADPLPFWQDLTDGAELRT